MDIGKPVIHHKTKVGRILVVRTGIAPAGDKFIVVTFVDAEFPSGEKAELERAIYDYDPEKKQAAAFSEPGALLVAHYWHLGVKNFVNHLRPSYLIKARKKRIEIERERENE